MSFENFKKQQEANRSSMFTGKNPKKKRVSDVDEEVKIQVGVLHAVDGSLRKIKGRTLPVTVSPNSDAKSLLQAAIEKHGKHFQQFDVSYKYVLLYPDYTLVNKLPGNFQDFTLGKYKDDLGKSYAKIYLWLCKNTDYEVIQVDDTDSDHEGSCLKPALMTENANFKTTHEESSNTNATPIVNPHHTTTSSISDPILISDQGQGSSIVVIADNGSNADNTLSYSNVNPTLNISYDRRKEEATALCPTCYRSIPISLIEEHADLCADNFDPVGEISGNAHTQDSEVLSDDTEVQMQSNTSACTSEAEKKQKMEYIVSQFQTNIDTKKTLVSEENISYKITFLLEINPGSTSSVFSR